MALALVSGEERRLPERHARLVTVLAALLGERDGDDVLLAALALLIPLEGENEPLGFHHFAEHAAVPEFLAGLDVSETDAPFAADARIDLDMGRGMMTRTPPVPGV